MIQYLKSHLKIYHRAISKKSTGRHAAIVYLSNYKGGSKYYSNLYEMECIIEILKKAGWQIDVYDCRDHGHFLLKRKYDLIFGFGKIYRKLKKYNKNRNCILYLTEAPPELSIFREQQRLDALRKRSKINIPITRSGTYYTIKDIVVNTDICCLGEMHSEYLQHEYPNKKVSNVNPTAIPTLASKKSFRRTDNILWFGSRGVIHKGLDVLCEAVQSVQNKRLIVAGNVKKEIDKYPSLFNHIEYIGTVDVMSDKFQNMIDNVDYCIFPSCSEAVPTAVLTLMRAGVPVFASNQCGTKFNDLITIHALNTPDDIKELILSLDFWTESAFRKYAVKSRQATNYSIETYEKTMSNFFLDK